MSDLASYITQATLNGQEQQALAEHPSTRANGQPALLPCRYDAAHGTFTNPKALGDHYRAEHPEYVPVVPTARSAQRAPEPEPEPVSERLECPAPGCGKLYLYKQGLNNHIAKHHPALAGPVGRPADGPEGPRLCVCGQALASKDSARKHVRRKHPGSSWLIVTKPVTPEGGALVPVARTREATVADDEAPPIDAAYIMHTVIGALMHPDGTVPVAHLEHIYVWREATATMLRAIAPEQ